MNEKQEKIYIIQPIIDETFRSLQKEAISLIESAGALYAGTIYQKIREINPATIIGAGKLAELKDRLNGLGVSILYNGTLSPSQTLNISAALGGLKVIDRTTLILDIFAKNAKSSEGKLQVELAQLKYNYPRLKGKGEALSRLGGGIGTRGPGETQLETDRRRIKERIDYLEKKLLSLKYRQNLLTHRRQKNSVNTISLIGYTNTGKSTLMNVLTGANVYAENRLFATLDLTARKLIIDGVEFLLTDTVGFLRELPHNLIASFHTTLESALNCDLALIVCDVTDDYEMQLKTTLDTLHNLDFNTPYLIVMNKCESIDSFEKFPSGCIFISAKHNLGIDGLKNEILNFFNSKYTEVTLRIPYYSFNAYHKLRKYVTTEKQFIYKNEYIEIEVRIPCKFLEKFSQYLF